MSLIKVVNGLAIDFMFWTKWGRNLFERLAKPYTAGSSIEEGLITIQNYRELDLFSTFDVLGEEAKSVEKADEYFSAYKDMVDIISEAFGEEKASSISVKLTSICKTKRYDWGLVTYHNDTPVNERLEEIVSYAAEKNIDVTLDMEDHPFTQVSLEAAKHIWNRGYTNFGIVLQSRLNRTKEDIKKVLVDRGYKTPKENMRVRACIGIYNEPDNIAVTSKGEAKERLIERVGELFDAGAYLEIATHDILIIGRILSEVIRPKKIDSNRFEFQFLKGVQNAYDIRKTLQNQGYKVRFYMPVELNPGDGTEYMKRRLKSNPELIWSGIKNMFQKATTKSSSDVP